MSGEVPSSAPHRPFTISIIDRTEVFSLHFTTVLPSLDDIYRYRRSPNFHAHVCGDPVAHLKDICSTLSKFLLFGHDTYVGGAAQDERRDAKRPTDIISVTLKCWPSLDTERKVGLQRALEWMYEECLKPAQQLANEGPITMILYMSPQIACVWTVDGVRRHETQLPRFVSDELSAWAVEEGSDAETTVRTPRTIEEPPEESLFSGSTRGSPISTNEDENDLSASAPSKNGSGASSLSLRVQPTRGHGD